jgi:trehalose 6-phosphate phosphatase
MPGTAKTAASQWRTAGSRAGPGFPSDSPDGECTILPLRPFHIFNAEEMPLRREKNGSLHAQQRASSNGRRRSSSNAAPGADIWPVRPDLTRAAAGLARMRSLMADWDGIELRLARGPMVLFLDYDGTLSPIVRHPRHARMPEAVKEIVTALARQRGTRVAVISGRSLADLRRRVHIRGVALAGNHGLELKGPGFRYRPRLPAGYAKTLAVVRAGLRGAAAAVKGAQLEDKGLTLTFHYRRSDAKDRHAARTAFLGVTAKPRELGTVEIREGKRVLEVRPPVAWTKGHAVRWLLNRRNWLPRGRVSSAVYIGDDRTDEDAFRELGNRGITVRVGRSKHSCAVYYLRDTKAVRDFLERLLTLRKGAN